MLNNHSTSQHPSVEQNSIQIVQLKTLMKKLLTELWAGTRDQKVRWRQPKIINNRKRLLPLDLKRQREGVMYW